MVQYAWPSEPQVQNLQSILRATVRLVFLKYPIYLLTPTFQNFQEFLLPYLLHSFCTNLASSSTVLKGIHATIPQKCQPILSHTHFHQCHLIPSQTSLILQGLNGSRLLQEAFQAIPRSQGLLSWNFMATSHY